MAAIGFDELACPIAEMKSRARIPNPGECASRWPRITAACSVRPAVASASVTDSRVCQIFCQWRDLEQWPRARRGSGRVRRERPSPVDAMARQRSAIGQRLQVTGRRVAISAACPYAASAAAKSGGDASRKAWPSYSWTVIVSRGDRTRAAISLNCCRNAGVAVGIGVLRRVDQVAQTANQSKSRSAVLAIAAA